MRQKSHRRRTWMEKCVEDVEILFEFTAHVTNSDLDSMRFALAWRMAVDFVLGHICFGPWVIAFWRGTWDSTLYYSKQLFQVRNDFTLQNRNAATNLLGISVKFRWILAHFT